jgi:hypothetical protein
MKTTTDWLSSAIREFITILNQCLNETTFVEDRRLYADDHAAANGWLTRLAAGEPPTVVAAEILAPATAKQFTDYWRQGTWGDLESAALNTLQDTIRRRLARAPGSGLPFPLAE